MSDFTRGLLIGALIALYVAWMLGPLVRWELHRRRVLREAERRLAAAEARMRARSSFPATSLLANNSFASGSHGWKASVPEDVQ